MAALLQGAKGHPSLHHYQYVNYIYYRKLNYYALPLDVFAEIAIVIAGFLMAMGLRSYSYRFLRVAGSLLALTTTFLAGYFIGGHYGFGIGAMLAWMILPWIEILTHVRKVRLPLDRTLEGRFAPPRQNFPELGTLSEQLEEAGFVKVEDAGWNWGSIDQFMRLYVHEDARLEANICLTDQEGMRYSYLSFTSRAHDGTIYTTWNFPFAHSMQLPPEVKLVRCLGEYSPSGILAHHNRHLRRHGVNLGDVMRPDPEKVAHCIEGETRSQILHNIRAGVITPAGSGTFRYSWRGWCYLWFQTMRTAMG